MMISLKNPPTEDEVRASVLWSRVRWTGVIIVLIIGGIFAAMKIAAMIPR